jgi:hypothetical protein
LVTITAGAGRIAPTLGTVTTDVRPVTPAFGAVTADNGRIAAAYRTITGGVGPFPTSAALPARLIAAATITARGAAPVARAVALLVAPRPTAP